MVLLKWKIEQKKCRTRRLYLLLLFSLCGTFMVFIGGKACKNLNRYKADQFGSSLVLHYIANQVRQSDGEDRIKVVEVDGISVLELEQNFDEVSYIKWIYCCDGIVRELFTRQGSGMGLMDGIPVMECDGISFVKNGRLLTVKTTGKEGGYLYLYLRSER